jgi:hypothetical protein
MYAEKCEEKAQLGKYSGKWEANISLGLKYDRMGVVLTGLVLFKVWDQWH